MFSINIILLFILYIVYYYAILKTIIGIAQMAPWLRQWL